MNGQSMGPVEPWAVRETELKVSRLGQYESVFALANGHVGWRGNLDEGEPHGTPGSYLNGMYEQRPMPPTEHAYGNPESSETMINVTNGKIIRLLVDDEPFDIRYGTLRSHERVLDLRAGVLDREAEWVTPTGSTVRVRSRRLVSFTQRAIAAIRYEVEPLTGRAHVVVQSELVANEELPQGTGDPRVAEAVNSPLVHEADEARADSAILMHRTRLSRLRLAVAMDHQVQCPGQVRHHVESRHDLARLTLSTVLQPGERLVMVKFVAHGWSQVRSWPALYDQVEGALATAALAGWEGLLAEQREYLDRFWDRAWIEVEGDDEVQQAVRFALFHVLQASARAEGRPIPAKGLTGTGYDGHAFWDSEIFVMPVLVNTVPEAAAAALRWRHSTLDLARQRARELGLAGAAFPWRTISGRECSGYWPAGTAAFHINAGIAESATAYARIAADEEFEAAEGLDLLVETARLWRSLGHYDAAGVFRIDGVTGPDEYSAIADNNVYTNLMAQQNLRDAARAVRRHPGRAAGLRANEQEAADWLAAAQAMAIPFDDRLGVHPQAEGFTEHEEWDFAATTPQDYPLMLHFPYFDLYRKQVVKQADLVLAMQFRPDCFTAEQMARNFAYYERRTVRDSSLSTCSQAIVAAEVGHLDLAYDYVGEAVLMDWDDLRHDTTNGLHIAALGGAWLALVWGLGGLRRQGGQLRFAPRLPARLERLAFTVALRGRRLRVEATRSIARYLLMDGGEQVEIIHHGDRVVLSPGEPVSLPIPRVDAGPAPVQPHGRAPVPRR
jgi:alpha,alpha-trehalose phosphorylase